MAGTPLTDSIEALTAYANQVTGVGDTNLSDAVYTLVQGYGGGGESPFAINEIVVGENSVTNMADAHDYFFSSWAVGTFLLLKDAPTTYNQLVCMMPLATATSGSGGRYREGVYNTTQLTITYDAVLVPGTTYYRIYLK